MNRRDLGEQVMNDAMIDITNRTSLPMKPTSVSAVYLSP
jgi:hypothetical protein